MLTQRLSDAAVNDLVQALDLTDLIARIGPTVRPEGARRGVMVFLAEHAGPAGIERLTSGVRATGWAADVNRPRTKVYVYEPAGGEQP